jgi:hypothetical protein
MTNRKCSLSLLAVAASFLSLLVLWLAVSGSGTGQSPTGGLGGIKRTAS